MGTKNQNNKIFFGYMFKFLWVNWKVFFPKSHFWINNFDLNMEIFLDEPVLKMKVFSVDFEKR
jgi:hypothetical protein